MENQARTANSSYPSSAAAVVLGGHLYARAAFRLDRKVAHNSQLPIAATVMCNAKRHQTASNLLINLYL